MLDVLAAVVLVDRVSDPDYNVAVASVRQDSDLRLGRGDPYQAEEEEGGHHLQRPLRLAPQAAPFAHHHVTAIDDCLRLISLKSTTRSLHHVSSDWKSSFRVGSHFCFPEKSQNSTRHSVGFQILESTGRRRRRRWMDVCTVRRAPAD